MRKSTVHCPTYYNITYLGELLEHEDEEEDATEEKTDAGCSHGSQQPSAGMSPTQQTALLHNNLTTSN